jgi:eukaryotic-like serine/threonine-protein kinase
MSAKLARIEEVFQHARELCCEQRSAHLAEACAGDAALLAKVRAMLQAHDVAEGFLPEEPRSVPPLNPPAPHSSEEGPGTAIGRYKLQDKIGEGGCGIVYVAQQEHPVRRRVALKIIKLGMETKEVIARFEAERQALALMDHPNIAKVLTRAALNIRGAQKQIPERQGEVLLL